MIVDATGAKYRVVRTAQDGLGVARADGGSTRLDGARHRADRGGAPDASAAPPGEN